MRGLASHIQNSLHVHDPSPTIVPQTCRKGKFMVGEENARQNGQTGPEVVGTKSASWTLTQTTHPCPPTPPSPQQQPNVFPTYHTDLCSLWKSKIARILQYNTKVNHQNNFHNIHFGTSTTNNSDHKMIQRDRPYYTNSITTINVFTPS